MIRYVLKRILWTIPVVIIVSFVVFALIDAAPGDFVDTQQISDATPELIAEVRAFYGLDQPMIVRYGKYMLRFVQGDMGVSYVSGMPVWDRYIQRLPNTLMLSLGAIIIGALISVPLGIAAAKRAGKIADNLASVFALIGLSMPSFWLGILLLMLFSETLRWLPAGGMQHGFKSFVLPAVCSALMLMGTAVRQTRSSMLEVLNSDYLRTARAKGVPERKVIRKHALGNAWIPILTTLGMSLSVSLASSAIVENVFAWPGVGRLLVEAVTKRDSPLITGTVIMTTVLYILILLIVDLSYTVVDPRIKAQFSFRRKKISKPSVTLSDDQNTSEIKPLEQESRSVSDLIPQTQPERSKTADILTVSADAPTECAESFCTRKVVNDGTRLVPIGQERSEHNGKRGSADTQDDGVLLTKRFRKRSHFGEIIHHICQNKGAVVGLVVIAIMVICAITSFFMSFESVTKMNVSVRMTHPNWQFPFGTDSSGRNMFLRIIYGSRYSLIIGVSATLIQLVIGVSIGSIAGYFGGKVEDIIMRLTDILASIPGLLLGIVVITMLGQSLQNLILAVGISGVPIFVRITRASVLTVKNNEFVEAARAIGFSELRIIASQVLPNSLSPIIVATTTGLGVVIVIASSLSFLGFGVPVPSPEWGALISNSKDLMHQAPWLTTFPGLFIMLTVFGFNLLGDGLRDALDPKLKKI